MAFRLLVITPGFPKDLEDGSCIPPLQFFMRKLDVSRPDIIVDVISTMYPYTRGTYVWNGIDVHPLGSGTARWQKPFTLLRGLRLAKRLHSAEPYDAVHSFWLGEAAWIGDRFARALGIRHVCTLMGQDARDAQAWWQRLSATTTRIVALSARQAEAFHTMSGTRPDAIIPWGSPDPSKDHDHERTVDILFCGAFLPVKQPLLFVELVARIASEKRFVCEMIGDGPLLPRVKERIDELDLKEVITLRGQLPHHEVLRSMARSRVLVHTAEFEGAGYVFDEALAMGMSIVSFQVGTARNMEHWCVVRSDDEMTGAIIELLRDDELRVGITLHPIEDTVNAYLAAYDHC